MWERGAGGRLQLPPKFGQFRFFGQQEKFGQSQFLKKLFFFYVKIDLLHMLAYVSASYDPRFFSTVS